jgi:CRISPR/Cas system-associated exonuclease Cas4 (RecB family)
MLQVINSRSIRDYGLTARLPEVFDSTMITDFADCPSKFYLRHVLGLEPKTWESAIQLSWGSAWHKLQELYHKGVHEKDLSHEEAMMAATAYVAEKWDNTIDWSLDRNGRTMQRMMLMFVQYAERFKQEERYIEPLRSEQFFDIYCPEGNPDCPLGGGCGLRWCGRIDRLFRVRGKIKVKDYKTTSAMGAAYFDRYEHSFQMPGYNWGAVHLVPQGIDGIEVDVLYTLKASEDFFRRTFRYIPARLIEWRGNVKAYIEDIHSLWERYPEEPEAWRKNWSECTRFSTCRYAGIHFTAPISDTRLRIMSNDYRESRWDPSEVD